MQPLLLPRTLALVIVLAGLFSTAAVAAAPSASEEGFVPLLTRTDMSEFLLVATPPETWSVDGNVIHCTGTPTGYFATTRSYRNYVLRLDYRFVRPPGLVNDSDFRGNSGYMLHINGEHRVWPRCVEVQGMYHQIGRTFGLGGAPRIAATDNPEARRRAMRPVGEWNSIEITSQDGAVTVVVNGEVVSTAGPGEYREGPIGFQSEGPEMYFRNIRIKELP